MELNTKQGKKKALMAGLCQKDRMTITFFYLFPVFSLKDQGLSNLIYLRMSLFLEGELD